MTVLQLELMPHQLKAVNEMHNGCILRGDVGSGKSFTAIFYYYTKVCGGVPQIKNFTYQPMKTPKELYIITTAKKRDDLDWQDDLAKFGLGYLTNEHGIQAHVDSWQNISQHEMVEDAFFIFDEQRLVGNGEWVKTFLKLAKKNQWIILSATPGDTWMEYIPAFIANGFYRNRSDFVDQHVEFDNFVSFPRVKRFHNIQKMEHFRSKLLVDMPYKRHTKRHVEMVLTDYDKEMYKMATEKRWHPFEDRPIENATELQIVMRKIVNADVSRLGETMKILEKHPKLIIFYNFNYELDMLRIMASTLEYPVAEWNGKKHQPIPETDKWVYLVQYTAGAEGWNCIETDAVLFWSLNYSWKINEQCKGRIDRLNTPFTNLYYYYLRSMSPIDTRIWTAILKKESFNIKVFIKQVWDAYTPF